MPSHRPASASAAARARFARTSLCSVRRWQRCWCEHSPASIPPDTDNSEKRDYFTDDSESPYQESINRLMAAGVTMGCNPPDNDQFCPGDSLVRAQMASFFVRALDG